LTEWPNTDWPKSQLKGRLPRGRTLRFKTASDFDQLAKGNVLIEPHIVDVGLLKQSSRDSE
jgi:hypothetical protein